jgi:hypothetical protein
MHSPDMSHNMMPSSSSNYFPDMSDYVMPSASRSNHFPDMSDNMIDDGIMLSDISGK